jgi:hypothetical protein
MIDNLSLLLSHGLILIACWRLLSRRDLDSERGQEDGGIVGRARPRGDAPRHDAEIGDA